MMQTETPTPEVGMGATAQEGARQMQLSARDRAILRAQVADKIEVLMPLVEAFAGGEWRPSFESQARALRVKANGCPVNSEARADYLAWAIAHQFVLEEQS